MKTLSILAAALLPLSGIASAEEPDYKALYLKANDAAAKWKARAEMLAARLAESEAETQDARAMLRRARQPAPPPLPQAASREAEPSLFPTINTSTPPPVMKPQPIVPNSGNTR